jgi:peptidoglycan/LPS O-acetylase OafA/YrhL
VQRRYIKSHASLRGIAALLVVFYHIQFGEHVRLFWEVDFFRKGYLWVDLFFILSGFVISYTAALGKHSWPQVKAFWRARFARIYPLHAFCLLALIGVALGKTAIGIVAHKPDLYEGYWSAGSLTTLGLQFALLNGFGGGLGWNIPSWSISTEAVAYLLFPLMALAWRWPFLVGAAAFYLWIGLTTGNMDIVSGVAVLRCLSGFSIGMALCAWQQSIDRIPWHSFWQIVGLAIPIVVMATGANDTLAIPGFILLVASTWPDRGVLCSVLKLGPLVWLGEISYSIYLNHFWVLDSINFVLLRALPKLGLSPYGVRWVSVLCGIVAVLIVSHLTWKLIEMPFRRYLRPKRPASATA